MKRLQKQALFLIMLLGALLLFSACGAASTEVNPYVGTWVSNTLETNGTVYYTEKLVGEYTMEFKADKTVTIKAGDQTEEATYESASNGVMIRYGSGESTIMESKGENLILEVKGIKFTFEKQ